MGILKSISQIKRIEYLAIPALILLSFPALINLIHCWDMISREIEDKFIVEAQSEHKIITYIFRNNPDNNYDEININQIFDKSDKIHSIAVFQGKDLLTYNNKSKFEPQYDSLMNASLKGFNSKNDYYTIHSTFYKDGREYSIFSHHKLTQLHKNIDKTYYNLFKHTAILLIIYLILLFIITYYFTQPIKDISNQVTILAEGKVDTKISNINGIVEFQTIADNINKIIDNQSKSNKVVIDELKELVKNLEARNKELTFAKNKAVEANELKNEFLSNVSHEIRTPLNAIIGFTDFLLTKLDDQVAINYLKIIKNSSKTLLALINDILDISKIEAGKLEIKQSPTNLIKMLEEIAEIFEPKAIEKGLAFYKIIPTTFPQVISVDDIRLRQVLFNLLGNAIKFTEKGYVSISLVMDRCDRESEFVDFEISVKDTGIGIPVEDQIKIFEPFVQQEGQSFRKFGGTGLGLAISKKLVEKMQGRIDLVSQLGVGSNFIVSFKNVEFKETNKIQNEPITPVNYDFPEANILIVDDMEVNRQVVKELFADTPLKFYEAADGVQAIDVAKTQKIDLILMDVRMPIMDGNEATNILKNNEETKHIPIVALTASTNHILQNNLVHSVYFDEIILKPAETHILKSVIYKYLTASRSKPLMHQINKDNIQNNPFQNLDEELKLDIANRFKESAKQLKSKLYMSEAKTFSENFRNYSNNTNNEVIIEFAREFENSIKTFQLNKIKLYLENFINI